MSTLRKYYQDLLSWEQLYGEPVEQQSDVLRESSEGQQQRDLVAEWPHTLRESIESALVNAVSESAVKGSTCPLRPGSTNQAIGNQVEKYTMGKLNRAISDFSISPCRGAGYPDQLLTQTATNRRIPLEVKATSIWDPSDSNRRVLTSSSKKLQIQFRDPIYHLILTVLYTENENLATNEKSATIDAIRLDFLEPTTPVNVRLEASVNHKILAEGHHHSKII